MLLLCDVFFKRFQSPKMQPRSIRNGQQGTGGMKTDTNNRIIQSHHLQTHFPRPVPNAHLMSQTTTGHNRRVCGMIFHGPRRAWVSLECLKTASRMTTSDFDRVIAVRGSHSLCVGRKGNGNGTDSRRTFGALSVRVADIRSAQMVHETGLILDGRKVLGKILNFVRDPCRVNGTPRALFVEALQGSQFVVHVIVFFFFVDSTGGTVGRGHAGRGCCLGE